MKKIIVAMFVLHALCATAWAADLNLKWDSVRELFTQE